MIFTRHILTYLSTYTIFYSATLSNLFPIHSLVLRNLILSLLNIYTSWNFQVDLRNHFLLLTHLFLTGLHFPTHAQNLFLLFTRRPTFFLHSEYIDLSLIHKCTPFIPLRSTKLSTTTLFSLMQEVKRNVPSLNAIPEVSFFQKK